MYFYISLSSYNYCPLPRWVNMQEWWVNITGIYSDKVTQPVAVRYAWTNAPVDASLFNVDGFPASPFRTDNWPGITEGKKFE